MIMDTTKYKPYPGYKDSGVEWLGEVPEHWEVMPVKRGFDVRLGKMLQTEASSQADELCHYLRAANIQWFGIDASDIKQMWFSPKERQELALVDGDLLVSEGGDVGRSTIWCGEVDNCYFQNSVNRVRSRDKNSTRFLYYWISEIKDSGYIDVLCNKSTIAHFTAEKVQAVPTPLPPTVEQRTIATFLDRETAKIDTLIAKQERLIELLGEKRTALISHAVTKGLNPDAPMKDSGVEWLGKVPAHWDATQLRRYIFFITSGSRGWAEHYAESGSIFVRIGNLTRNSVDIDLTDIQYVQPPAGSEGERTAIKKDDILFSITAYLGSVAVAKKEIEGAYVSQHVALVRVDANLIYSRFIAYAMLSDGGKNQLQGNAYGGAKVQLGLEDVKETWIPVPPLEEQKTIAAFLDRETAKIDTLITKARRATDLLKERRTALISAAVTGKIDVREALPSLTE